MAQSSPPHSAAYFGRQRDFWWNPDFLALMATRCELDKARRVLDVGCGVGHWGRALAPFLSPEATVVGVDREPKWVEQSTARAPDARFTYRLADAGKLPFADGTFDLVTCQTVLIHVADRPAVLRELSRVLVPRGRFLLVEPCNLASAANGIAGDLTSSIDDLVDAFRFQLTCERGKSALGLGFNSAGELIPGELAALGVDDLRVFLSDRAAWLVPPYETEAQRAQVEQSLEWRDKDFWIWDEEETRRYFLAGGGTEAEFERLWAEAMKERRSGAKKLQEKKLATAGGTMQYLITARKR